MTSPIDFIGKIPKMQGRLGPVVIDDEAVSALPLAYMVDGKPSMHALAGIGGYRVCDCILPTQDGAVMIEHSWLKREMKNMKKDHGYDSARELLIREYCLKAYGSMLVLCRLFFQSDPKHSDEMKKFAGVRCEFWIVISDAKTEDKDVMAFQFLKDALDKRAYPLFSKSKVLGKNMLKDALGKVKQSGKRRKG